MSPSAPGWFLRSAPAYRSTPADTAALQADSPAHRPPSPRAPSSPSAPAGEPASLPAASPAPVRPPAGAPAGLHLRQAPFHWKQIQILHRSAQSPAGPPPPPRPEGREPPPARAQPARPAPAAQGHPRPSRRRIRPPHRRTESAPPKHRPQRRLLRRPPGTHSWPSPAQPTAARCRGSRTKGSPAHSCRNPGPWPARRVGSCRCRGPSAGR